MSARVADTPRPGGDARREPRGGVDERELSEQAWAIAVAGAIRHHAGVPDLATEAAAAHGPRDDDAPNPVPPLETASGDDESSPTQRGTNAAGNADLEQLHTVLEDSHFGRLELEVSRASTGLHIVINVADSHVKSMIESEATLLSQSLRDSGFAVSSVEIVQVLQAGTGLAVDRGVARDRARSHMNPRLEKPSARAYRSTLDDDSEADSEGVNLEA